MIEKLNVFLQNERNKKQSYLLNFRSFSFNVIFFKSLLIVFCIGFPLFIGSVLEQNFSQLIGSFTPVVLIPLFFYSLFRFNFFKINRSPYQKVLKSVWESNGLVERETFRRIVTDSKGKQHDKSRTEVTGFLKAFIVANSPNALNRYCKVKFLKDGSKFQSMITNDLVLKISSAIGLPLDSEEDSISYHSFVFKSAVAQDIIRNTSFDRRDTSQKIYFYNNNCWDLTKAFSVLVSGVSGSGKSYFTYTLLTNFLNQRVYDNQKRCYHNNLIYLIDPKMSDAYKIASKSMPKDYYGSTKVDAFRIIRAFNSELEYRKTLYEKIDDFDTVLTDTGLVAPKLLVIEEFGSLMSSFSKKERDEYSDLLKNVLFQGRQLGLGCLIVSQKLNSEIISTAVRENLNYKFLLGKSFSNELADTVFGNHQDLPTPSDIKGSGLFAVDSDGGNVRKFIAPKFEGALFSTILPVWKSAYEEEFSCLSMVADEQRVGA